MIKPLRYAKGMSISEPIKNIANITIAIKLKTTFVNNVLSQTV